LPYGLEGYAPKRHLAKENGSFLGADEKAQFKVLEFNRNDKRILLSHARMWEEVKQEAEEAVKTEKKVEAEKTRSKVKDIQKSVEKSTFGDISALTDLKEKMEGKKEKAPKAEKAEVAADLFATEAPAKKAAKTKGTPVEDIEGVGPVYKEKLETADVTTVEGLLEAGADKKGRKALAEKTEIDEKLILKWVNHADLFRINGVAGQYAELLEASGVDTVKELRNRVPANLAAKMAEVNAEKNLTNKVPSETQVEKWVEEAKSLDPKVSH
jgi:predicted flap endonuclease-1-like 5' DNA nuclease